jgi:ribose transport system substrate-binding protein
MIRLAADHKQAAILATLFTATSFKAIKETSAMRNNKRWQRVLMAGLPVALVAALAACSSSGSNSSGASNVSSSSSPGLVQAEAIVKADTSTPSSIGITQPVGKPIPVGKHIVLIYAGQGAIGTQLVYSSFKQAAKVLGWSVTSLYPALPTPQDLQQALGQAIQLHPDAVVISAVDDAYFQSQINTLASMHIPVVATFSPNPTGGPITLSLMGAQQEATLTRVIGAKAVADLGGKGELGVIGLQGYKIVQEYDTGFYAEVRRTCPACTIKETDVPLTSLGTSDGTDIVNFLRANPDIKGLLLGYDGLGSDLYTAAKSAGITLPKVYSIATIPTGLQAAAAGELTATAPIDVNELGWRTADALARIFTGQTASALSQDGIYERPVIWSAQYHNVPSLSVGDAFPAIVTSYQAEYEKLWGK